MMPSRRRPLLLCSLLALAGVGAPQAHAAQGMSPLEIDPALLGGAAKVEAPANSTASTASKGTAPVEVRPVSTGTVTPAAAPAVVNVPVSAANNAQSNAPSSTTPAAPTAEAGAMPKAERTVVITPAGAPAPSVAPAPAPALAPAKVPAAAPVADKAAVQVIERSAAPQTAVRTMPAFEVDPRLLGAAPAAVVAGSAPTSGGNRPGASTATATVLPVTAANVANTTNAASVAAPGNEPAPATGDERTVYVAANRISGRNDIETVAEGEVVLKKGGKTLTADKVTYWPVEDEAEALGNVVLTEERGVISGPKLRMKVGDQIGTFDSPTYAFRQESRREGVLRTATAYGQADKMDFMGIDKLGLTNATYSTCKPDKQDWYAHVDELKLDYEKEEGEGSNGTVYFKGMPILYAPDLSFALDNARKSGFLAPTIGSTSIGGVDVILPYYWNIAPNRDATLAPRLFTKRGLQLNGEFRYLEPSYQGSARIEWLPHDQVRGMERHAFAIQHTQALAPNLFGTLNLNGVSDDYYYTDLSSRIGITSQTNFVRQGVLTYLADWWNVQGQVLRYQTVQTNPAAPVPIPYQLTPQFTLNALRPDVGRFDLGLFGQYSSFSHPTQVEGQRIVAYPQVSMPYVTPGYYITPKVGVHLTDYSLTHQAAGLPTTINRSVPIMSLDAGMTFERNASIFGRDVVQTLEPRLYYLNVPSRDQSKIPVFDSALADFNFSQIFAENLYTGQDRIADANQLTAALTSRLINPATGAESLRGMIGQRFYFRDQTVSLLPTDPLRSRKSSDFLTAVSGTVAPKVTADVATQYNLDSKQLSRVTLAGHYFPGENRVFNASYRYTRDLVSQIDVTGQWPIAAGWYAVGRYNYSFKESRLIETIGGLEYNGGCWVGRAVLQRFAATADQPSTAFFLQLELNDFSRIGSNPLDLLKRSIQGYGKLNSSAASPIFGSE